MASPDARALRPALAKVAEGAPLSRAEARAAFDAIMEGAATEAQIAGLLMAMHARGGGGKNGGEKRGETLDEIIAAAEAMRARMLPVEAPADAVDLAGVGGDGKGSINISTLASFMVAGCGVPVAKHGNRAASSRCGSADVLEALGGAINLPPEAVAVCIRELGFGFMFAPVHHPAMRFAAPVRAQLGAPTLFNLLGPLVCPARARRQLIGAPDAARAMDVARAAVMLGAERVWAVHGQGYDEIALSGPTQVVEARAGSLASFVVTPEECGLARAEESALVGGEPRENAAVLRAVLEGGGPQAVRDAGLINAAAALVVAGRAETLREGVELARAALDAGKTGALLAAWTARSRALAPTAS